MIFSCSPLGKDEYCEGRQRSMLDRFTLWSASNTPSLDRGGGDGFSAMVGRNESFSATASKKSEKRQNNPPALC
jgi:hypothetical protein